MTSSQLEGLAAYTACDVCDAYFRAEKRQLIGRRPGLRRPSEVAGSCSRLPPRLSYAIYVPQE